MVFRYKGNKIKMSLKTITENQQSMGGSDQEFTLKRVSK